MVDLVLDGRLFLAPIGENPQRILDLATGTGIWAIDMGMLFYVNWKIRGLLCGM